MSYFVSPVQITVTRRNPNYCRNVFPQREGEKEDKTGFHGYFVNHPHFAVYTVYKQDTINKKK